MTLHAVQDSMAPLLVEEGEYVTHLRLNRPHESNALNGVLLEALIGSQAPSWSTADPCCRPFRDGPRFLYGGRCA